MAVTQARTRQPGGGPEHPRLLGARTRKQLTGAAGMLVVAGIIGLVILAYQQAFTPTVRATVVADRAGLLMYNGADVTLHGVTVGRVTSVTPAGGQAKLGIAIDPGRAGRIPANVEAAISDSTVFGPKYIDLVVPGHPSNQGIQAGQVIETASTPTEVNMVFQNLVAVLGSVHPAKLSATLGALSTALQGRGQELGSFIAELNSYLREFNPSLPALSRDLGTAPRVLSAYAAAAPGLVSTLGNLQVTSGTLASQQAQFDAFLLDLTGFSGNTRAFLAGNESALAGTLATLAPVTALAAEYSPEFPCLFASVADQNAMSTSSKIVLHTTILPGQQGYQYPRDLPKVAAASGPSCYGGPITPTEAANYPLITFNDGTGSYASHSDSLSPGSPPLAVQLFGSSGSAAKGH